MSYDAAYLREKKRHPHEWMGGPQHGIRVTRAQRRRIIDRCLEYDGPYCQGCGEYVELNGKPEDYKYKIFTVNHIDGDASNHYFDNLNLMHAWCNNQDRFKNPKSLSALHRLEKEKNKNTEPHTEISLQEIIDNPKTSVEVTLNIDHEIAFRRYVFQRMVEASQKGLILTAKELRADAREYSGSSLASSYSYVERLLAKTEGPLVEDYDEYAKTKFLRFRNPEDRKLTVEELMMKYPKTGKKDRIITP